MSVIVKQDTNGTKPLLEVGELGYDNYPTGGDEGRVWVGTGTSNIAQAKKSEVTAVDSKVDTHVARVDNPHGVTKAQVGLGNANDTSDADKPISNATQTALNGKLNTNENAVSATKLQTARTINGVSFDGSANINIGANDITTGTLSVDRLPTIPNTKISGLGTASTKNVGTTIGNVMEVGAFGLGSTTIDLPNGNLRLRTYWETVPNGFYWANNSQNNYPGAVATYCFYLVHRHGAHINVTAYPYNSYKMFLLSMAKDQTTDAVWVEFLSTNNILTSTGQSTVYPMTQKAVTDAIQGVSDARDKFNIQNTNIGLELIEKLDVVTYNLNKRDWYRSEKATITEEIELEDGTKETTTKIDDEILKSDLKKYDKNDGHLAKNSIYTGLIAQDVKEAYESLGLDLSIVKNMKDEYEGGDDRYYIEYNGLVPILINAIKELNNKVKSLEDRLNEQIPEGGN